MKAEQSTCEHSKREIATCGNCERSWCDACDPTPSALCHWCHGRGHSTAERSRRDWRLVKVDFTRTTGEDWLAEKGIVKIGIYYLIDANRHVHICSLTPSLEAWAMHAWIEYASDEAAEKDQGESEIEFMSSEEPCTYFDRSVLTNRWEPVTFDFDPREEEENADEYYLRCVEQLREYLAGNPAGF